MVNPKNILNNFQL